MALKKKGTPQPIKVVDPDDVKESKPKEEKDKK